MGSDTTLLSTSGYSGSGIYSAIVKLSDSKVLVITNSDNSVYGLYGVLCTISGTSVTVKSTKSIASSSGWGISAVKINDTKILIICRKY